jgi:hypothetical protein
MARTPFEAHPNAQSGQPDHKMTSLHAEDGGTLDLPHGDFVANADMLRDGQDLILRTANGDEVRVEGYFSAEPAPMLLAPNGSALTPDLVESFVKPEGGMQYAALDAKTDASPVGEVREVSGKATVTHPDGTTETIAIGTKIYQGDIIETDAAGAVNIQFIDESSFAVSQNAKLAIDEYVFDPASQGGESNFSVLRGVFVFTSGLMGRDDPDDVHINTPVGSIGIRGTTIAGQINPNGECQITVVEGAIVIQNGSGETTLSSEFETVHIKGFNAPIENVGTLTAEQMSQSYDSVRSVSPVLFNTIDEKGNAEHQNNGQGDAHKNENGQQQESAPETAPQPTGEATEQTTPQEQGAIAEPQPDGTTTLADAEKPLDSSIEAAGEQPLQQPTDAPLDPLMMDGTQMAGEPLPPPPVMPTGFFGDMTFSGTMDSGFDTSAGFAPPPIGMDSTINASGVPVTNIFAPPPPPPPAGILPPPDTTQAGTTGTAGTTNAPLPPPPPLAIDFQPLQVLDTMQAGDVVAQIKTTANFPVADFTLINVPTTGSPSFMPLFELVQVNANMAVLVLTADGAAALDPGDIFGGVLIEASLPDGRTQTGTYALSVFDPPPPPLDLNVLGAPDGVVINGAAASGEQFGHSIAALGDFNNDGYADFIVSNGVDTGTLGGIGSRLISGGGFGGTVGPSYDPGNSDISLMQVAGIGDFNRDGSLDYMQGFKFADDAGVNGNTGQIVVSGSASEKLTGLITGDRAGEAVAGIGDLNGDGRSDVAIGAPGTLGDKGAVYVLFGADTPPTVADVSTTYNGFKINGLSVGDLVGGSLASAGDFDNDGFADFVIGARGRGEAYIVMGKAGIANVDLNGGTLASNVIKVTGLNTAAGDTHLPVVGLGDMNGDGISDIGIASTGSDGGRGLLHILYGSATYNPGQTINLSTGVVPTGQGFTLALPPQWSGSEIVGGGSAGDFNGDGINDIAVAVRTGTIADIYVIYGQAGLSGLVGNHYDPAHAFHMTYNIGNTSAFDFNIATVGDTNGDGRDDLAIGMSDANGGDGAVLVVFGQDQTGVTSNLASATGNGSRLVGTSGNEVMDDSGYVGVSMQTGAGNDDLVIHNSGFLSLDGGTGMDTLQMMGTSQILNLSLLGSEKVSGIEKFIMGANGQVLTLGLDDIFQFMQESVDNKLRITEGAGGLTTTFHIDDHAGGGGTLSTLMPTLGFTSAGTVNESGVNYDAYNFGSYQLLVDQNIDAKAVV